MVSRRAQLWQLMVTKYRKSPFANTRTRRGESDSIIVGFIVFEVAWKDVRGIKYLNELQTDTFLATAAKYMRRWEFDSISQAAKSITSWFPGTVHEHLLLKNKLNSMLGLISEGDAFHDAPDCHGTDDDDDNGGGDDEQTEILQDQMGTIDEAIQYRYVLVLFRFNEHDLPFELRKIITLDFRLHALLEAGLPSWATAACLCGPLFGWIDTWEILSRIKYLGTMLFLRNFEKAFKWFLRMSLSIRSCISVLTQPLSKPFMVFLEVLLPICLVYIQMGKYLCSFIWVLITTCWNLVDNLINIILFPLYFISSTMWMIVTSILYPIFWLICGILYAPIGLIIGLSNSVEFMINQMYGFIGDIWLFVSGAFKLASAAESTVSSHEVSMWRTLWNDLFSHVVKIFREVRSILRGLVAFFAAFNPHQLSIYNHVQEFIRRLYQLIERSPVLSSIQRATKQGSKTMNQGKERKKPLLVKSIKHN